MSVLRMLCSKLLLSLFMVLTVDALWTEDTLSTAINSHKDNVWQLLRNVRNRTLPNLKGCERTQACFTDLLTSTGFSTDPLPNYGLYLAKMTKLYSSGKGLQKYCGTFDAVAQCFSQESDSCRTPTVFAVLFDLSSDDAYRWSADLDLRKILCDNQLEMQDPCLHSMLAIKSSVPVENDAQASCENVAADLSAVISAADDTGCPDSVLSLFCQISAKTKEIETLGACDGKIPKCWTPFHSCDRMQSCFDQFYDGVEKAGVQSPLPDYASYASNMAIIFENAQGIDEMCSLEETLHTCLVRHIDKNCPLNAASFRVMYNMNYEQAYDYSTDFNLRKAQCLNKAGMKQNSCLANAKRLLNVCQPSIPHNLTLGRSCTDLRLAMKCNNFVVRQFCPDEAQTMYCEITSIIYEQGALGFCDGWMPECAQKPTELPQTTTTADVPTSTTRRTTEPLTSPRPTSIPAPSTSSSTSTTREVNTSLGMTTSASSLAPTTSFSTVHLSIANALLAVLIFAL